MTDLPDELGVSTTSRTSVSVAREQERVGAEIKGKVPVVEVGEVRKTEGEEEGYIERVEKEVELRKPVTDDYGQVLVTSAAAQQPKIILPMDRTAYLNPKNWHKPVTSALRWLLEWAKRIVKMNPGRTTFQEN